jgi:hypothetical protein
VLNHLNISKLKNLGTMININEIIIEVGNEQILEMILKLRSKPFVIPKSIIFWGIRSCSPLKVNRPA